jgi:hypothetical protein
LNSVTSLAKLDVCAVTGNTIVVPLPAVVCASRVDAYPASVRTSAGATVAARMMPPW